MPDRARESPVSERLRREEERKAAEACPEKGFCSRAGSLSAEENPSEEVFHAGKIKEKTYQKQMQRSKIDVILGIQWGDEGKGKIVDALSPRYDIIARFQGGPNAGHTIKFGRTTHVLHTIPSGIFHEGKVNVIGNGVLIDACIMAEEIESLRRIGIEPAERMKISDKAHLILPTHRLLDMALEQRKGERKIGSTVKGIGPAYTDKAARCGLRVGDIFLPDFAERYRQRKEEHLFQLAGMGFDVRAARIDNQELEQYEARWMEGIGQLRKFEVVPTELYLHEAMEAGKRILAEGAQGSLLDIDFGSYPFVTSSSTTASGVCVGLGVPPSAIGRVYGIFKAYCTRVGSGPFPTELFDATGETLREKGHEFGATTGRARRTGWLDLPALRYAIMINGVTDLVVMKADVLDGFPAVKAATGYKLDGRMVEGYPASGQLDQAEPQYVEMEGWQESLRQARAYEALPRAFRDYLKFIEKETAARITMVSVGPDREETLMCE